MEKRKMPVVFSGHGNPMLALDNNAITEEMFNIGSNILKEFGKPKAILAISGHWFTRGSYIQHTAEPRQVYDNMYGFPEELYDVKYKVAGSIELSEEVSKMLGDKVTVNNEWGIDHGIWTVLMHMFPNASIPVVQLSVNENLSPRESFQLGTQLSSLREEGYLIFGSGNVVHNIKDIDLQNPNGTSKAEKFNKCITTAIKNNDVESVIRYTKHDNFYYAVPTTDHFLPLLYCLGAAQGSNVSVFNNFCKLGSMAMTGYYWN